MKAGYIINKPYVKIKSPTHIYLANYKILNEISYFYIHEPNQRVYFSANVVGRWNIKYKKL